MAVGRLDARAHPAQRLVDPDRPRRQGLVARQLEAALLAGEDTAQQAEHGAGVPAVDRLSWCDELSESAAGDSHGGLVGLADLDPEGADGIERRIGICGVAEAAEIAHAVGDRRQQGSALADPLHRRHGDVADEGRSGLDTGHCSLRTGVTTTP